MLNGNDMWLVALGCLPHYMEYMWGYYGLLVPTVPKLMRNIPGDQLPQIWQLGCGSCFDLSASMPPASASEMTFHSSFQTCRFSVDFQMEKSHPTCLILSHLFYAWPRSAASGGSFLSPLHSWLRSNAPLGDVGNGQNRWNISRNTSGVVIWSC